MRNLVIAIIHLYQKTISPDHGWWANPQKPTCRFRPTCSEYMVEAISIHGIMAGGWMGVKRISRCHPLHPGGYDPVPTKRLK